MVDTKYDSWNNLYRVNCITPETEENLLLKRVAQGDRSAFWKIWKLYQDYLYHRSLVWMGGNDDDAQDVISLASLKAWQKLPDHAHKITNLKGWLHHFTHNICIDIHRQRQYQEIGVDSIEDVTFSHGKISDFDCPESKLLKTELHTYIRNCVDSLSPRLREPLILNYYRGMSSTDVGKQLSISPANVAKRLQEAKQKLKRYLQQYLAGLNTTTISANQSPQLAQQDLFLSTDTNLPVEEINYGTTILCLETLPPVWYNFPHLQDWI